MPPHIQQSHKFRVLDSWRGVAALLVAVFHLNIAGTIYSLGFVRDGYLFVDFFFVLSGFVITHGYASRLATPEQLGTFAFRRLGRLWPLHATVLLAFVVAESGKAVLATRGMSFYFPPFTGPYAPELIPLNLAFWAVIRHPAASKLESSELEHLRGVLDLPDFCRRVLYRQHLAEPLPVRRRSRHGCDPDRQRHDARSVRPAWHGCDL